MRRLHHACLDRPTISSVDFKGTVTPTSGQAPLVVPSPKEKVVDSSKSVVG